MTYHELIRQLLRVISNVSFGHNNVLDGPLFDICGFGPRGMTLCNVRPVVNHLVVIHRVLFVIREKMSLNVL